MALAILSAGAVASAGLTNAAIDDAIRAR